MENERVLLTDKPTVNAINKALTNGIEQLTLNELSTICCSLANYGTKQLRYRNFELYLNCQSEKLANLEYKLNCIKELTQTERKEKNKTVQKLARYKHLIQESNDIEKITDYALKVNKLNKQYELFNINYNKRVQDDINNLTAFDLCVGTYGDFINQSYIILLEVLNQAKYQGITDIEKPFKFNTYSNKVLNKGQKIRITVDTTVIKAVYSEVKNYVYQQYLHIDLTLFDLYDNTLTMYAINSGQTQSLTHRQANPELYIKLLQLLSPQQEQIRELAYDYQLSNGQIASYLNMTIDAVKVQKHRIQTKAKKIYREVKTNERD